MHPLIPQIIGILAVITFLFSYQQKKRRGIILLNALSRGLYIVQYLLLGAYAGAVLDILGTLSSLLAAKKGSGFIKRHTMAVLISADLLIVAAGLTVCFLNESPLDLLPIAGVMVIAAEAGFSCMPYFHRAFRRAFGVTPMTYRLQR